MDQQLSSLAHNNVATPEKINNWQLAIDDILQGFLGWQIWYTLAMQDIKLRYRRSVLGPFWITISMAIKIYAMGFIYGKLFNVNLETYFPYLAAGMIAWELIAGLISESLFTFTGSSGPIKEIKLAYNIYQHKTVFRNYIIFAHNAVVIIPIILFLHEKYHLDFYTLQIIPNLVLLYIIGLTFGNLLAIISARFNDIAQIIQSLIQIFFFITPVMWYPDRIHNHLFQLFCKLNPLYSLVGLIRKPLLGQPTPDYAYFMSLALVLVGTTLFLQVFKKCRANIVYWL